MAYIFDWIFRVTARTRNEVKLCSPKNILNCDSILSVSNLFVTQCENPSKKEVYFLSYILHMSIFVQLQKILNQNSEAFQIHP